MRPLSYFLLLPGLALACGAVRAEPWQGGLAGVTLGVEEVRDRAYSESVLAPSFAPFPIGTFKDTAPSLGLVAGYRIKAGHAVLGVEADADWSSASLTEREIAATNIVKPRWRASIRAVAGVPVGKALLFVTGGWGASRTHHRYSFNFGRPLPPGQETRTRGGIVYGAGVELATGRLHPRIEVRHTRYRGVINGTEALVFRHRVSSTSLRASIVLPM